MSGGPGQWVGSPGVRLATGGLVALGAAAALARPALPEWSGALGVGVLVAGVLALLGLIHSSRGLFARWMRVAEAVQVVVVTALFGAIYLLVVPVFTALRLPFDPLRLKRRARQESFWIRRSRRELDLDSLQRMG